MKNVIEATNNLYKYINEDIFYSKKCSVESDFDRFCYEHCEDIAVVLDALAKK